MSDVMFSMLNIKIWIEANRFSIICYENNIVKNILNAYSTHVN